MKEGPTNVTFIETQEESHALSSDKNLLFYGRWHFLLVESAQRSMCGEP